VARDVRERFLKDAEYRAGVVLRDHGAAHGDVEVHENTSSQRELLPLPLARGLEPQLVEHTGSQLRRDPPHGAQCPVDSVHHRLTLVVELVVAREATLHPRNVQLDSGECLAEFIMDFTGDCRPLFLADTLQPRGQGTKLLSRSTDSRRGLEAFRHIALNAEVTSDATAIVMDDDVVSLDAHRRTIQFPFLGLAMVPPLIEELAPTLPCLHRVVREKLRGRHTE
jgi:hypothetical protein